jgi:gallate decarboxylase subunit D
MKHFNAKAGDKQYLVEAEVIVCGEDLNICIGGGEVCHIGASALAVPRKSLADEGNKSASVSVLCVTGHKEDELARKTALELAALFQCKVNVTVGMHIDRATPKDIQILSANYEKVIDAVKGKISF